GIKTLIECARELPQINFVLAGTGPLEELCRDIKNVKALGFVSGDELKSLIANAAFTLCPSEWYENCPMSVVESLALGTPVIGSDLGGTSELISEGKTGFIFEAKNKEQLKEKITRLYNDDALLLEMSKSCLLGSTNTIENYSNTLIDIYNNLITQNER
ncbi:MAG: glycosyltransferase, partial [Eubacterium sp.]